MAKKEFSVFKLVFCSFLALIVGFIVGFCVYSYIKFPNPSVDSDKYAVDSDKPAVDSDKYVSGDLQIHFLEFNNKYCGDCTYIKAGDVDILIDAGSRTYNENIDLIETYLNNYVEDNKLEFVIATHADRDHIACFGTSVNMESLFDRFEIGTIIDFPKTNKDTDVYNNYIRERDDAVSRGATHYTALECWKEINGAQKVYELVDGIEMQILYNYYYENQSSDENNYSVCLLFKQGDKNFLFTGDLEEKGEEYLVQYNDLPEVELFKAGHHGSPTSSNDCLLDVIKPKICVVCCCAGSSEYTDNILNQFPSQAFINRISKHTDKVYVTSLCIDYDAGEFTSFNGNVVITSNKRGVEVNCSGSNQVLKDSEWFKEFREIPSSWQNTA